MKFMLNASLSLLVATLVMSAASAEQLRHNPFRPPVDLAGTSGSSGGGAAPTARPTLMGILLGKQEPLVNLGGNIIGVGEESAGYLLVEVGQEYAVFRRGEETITMSLYPGDDDE